jgi:hypothetical protein
MSALLVATQAELRRLEHQLKRKEAEEDGEEDEVVDEYIGATGMGSRSSDESNSKSFYTEVAMPPSHQRHKGSSDHGLRAKDSGVRACDMLKAVDGTDILQMEVDEEAFEHTAGDVLIGKQGSMCEPLLVRVENSYDSPTLADKVKELKRKGSEEQNEEDEVRRSQTMTEEGDDGGGEFCSKTLKISSGNFGDFALLHDILDTQHAAHICLDAIEQTIVAIHFSVKENKKVQRSASACAKMEEQIKKMCADLSHSTEENVVHKKALRDMEQRLAEAQEDLQKRAVAVAAPEDLRIRAVELAQELRCEYSSLQRSLDSHEQEMGVALQKECDRLKMEEQIKKMCADMLHSTEENVVHKKALRDMEQRLAEAQEDLQKRAVAVAACKDLRIRAVELAQELRCEYSLLQRSLDSHEQEMGMALQKECDRLLEQNNCLGQECRALAKENSLLRCKIHDNQCKISALIEESSSVRQECNMMVRERCRVHGTMHVWECEVENNGGRKKANTRFFISQSRARPVHLHEHEECNVIVRERSLVEETMHAGEYEGEKNGGSKQVNIVSTRHFSSQSPARPVHLLESTSKWRSPVPADTKSESRTRRKCTGGEANVGSAPVLLHSNGLVAKHSRYAIDVRCKL